MPHAAEDDFRPTASWKNLRLRADLLRRLREFFAAHEFLEVETPVLSADTVVDRHLDPFCVEVPGGGGEPPQRLWLQTSPEFAMKRLLAAGGQAIYQVTRAFRLGERGPLHNPEFTMVEWYRVGDGIDEGIIDEGIIDEGMRLTSDLCDALLQRGPARRVSYAEAFRRHVGLDPHTAGSAELVAAAETCGVVPPASLSREDRDGWLDLLLAERVQLHLGHQRPVLLYDYPAGQAMLARVRAQQPAVAERFELIVSGVELANGYHELLDPAELLRRNAAANAQRQADGKPTLPERSRLLAAMQAGLPAAVGVSLGFDRLVMLAAGAKDLSAVMAFPIDRA